MHKLNCNGFNADHLVSFAIIKIYFNFELMSVKIWRLTKYFLGVNFEQITIIHKTFTHIKIRIKINFPKS